MGKDDVTVKKRRKLNSSASAEAPKPVLKDVYKVSFASYLFLFYFGIYLLNWLFLSWQRVVDFEEAEAQLRPAEKDAILFKKICQDVRQLFADIAALKANDPEEVPKTCTY